MWHDWLPFEGKTADDEGNWWNCLGWRSSKQLKENLELIKIIWSHMGVILDKQVSLWVSKGSRQLSGGSMSFSRGFIGLNRTQLGSFGSVEISGGHLRVSEASWRSMSVTGAQWRPMGISGAHCAMHVHSVLHSFFSSFTCTTL